MKPSRAVGSGSGEGVGVGAAVGAAVADGAAEGASDADGEPDADGLPDADGEPEAAGLPDAPALAEASGVGEGRGASVGGRGVATSTGPGVMSESQTYCWPTAANEPCGWPPPLKSTNRMSSTPTAAAPPIRKLR